MDLLHTLRTLAPSRGFEIGVFAASAYLRESDRLGGTPLRGGLRDGPQRPPFARRYPETVAAGGRGGHSVAGQRARKGAAAPSAVAAPYVTARPAPGRADAAQY